MEKLLDSSASNSNSEKIASHHSTSDNLEDIMKNGKSLSLGLAH